MMKCKKCKKGFMNHQQSEYMYREYISEKFTRVEKGIRYYDFCSNVICDYSHITNHKKEEYLES